MEKGIIIYKSKYGTTKKYAEWLAKETQYDIVDITKTNIKLISNYSNIILCGAIYASGINGLSIISRNVGTGTFFER